jgi:hypothetical protein
MPAPSGAARSPRPTACVRMFPDPRAKVESNDAFANLFFTYLSSTHLAQTFARHLERRLLA